MSLERSCAWTLRTLVSLVVAVTLLTASPASAQEGQEAEKKSFSLAEALAEHRLPLALEEGRLTGPGAEWLWSRAADSAVVSLGESHATREIPQVMAAILGSLRPTAFPTW